MRSPYKAAWSSLRTFRAYWEKARHYALYTNRHGDAYRAMVEATAWWGHYVACRERAREMRRYNGPDTERSPER